MACRVPIEKEGFTVVYEAKDPKVPKVDVVFIHGLDGHPKDTWTYTENASPTKRPAKKPPSEQSSPTKMIRLDAATDQPRHLQIQNTEDAESDQESNSEWSTRDSVFWPAQLLPETVPEIRVLVYGWNSGVKSRKSSSPIADTKNRGHAESLLSNLELERRELDEKQRPLLFIAHSLGGIIVKEALRQSERHGQNKPHLHQIYESTIGILFFGTPHRGGNFPSVTYSSTLMSVFVRRHWKLNDSTIADLQPDSQMLELLRTEFPKLCREKQWMIYSFQEEIGSVLGGKCVADISSYIDDAEIEEKVRIGRDHVGMVKFSGKTDQEYKKVAGAITRIFDERKEVIEQNSRKISAALKREMEEKLDFEAMDKRVTNLPAAQHGTCRWFLNTKEYEKWQNPAKQSEHGGFLWIKGNPGTGKSTLMKFLFETTKERLEHDKDHIIASFFFSARGAVEEKTTKGLYQALLRQIFQWAPGSNLNESLEWISRAGAQGITANGWTEEALKQTLERAISKLGKRSLTVFIDALDECDDRQVKDMVMFIEELCAKDTTRKGCLQICLSSRHYPHIHIKKGLEIILEKSDGHAEDLKKYIKWKLRVGSSDAVASLEQQILTKSNSIFLWVVLVVQILNESYTFMSIKQMHKKLDEIPKDLADLFEMIIKRDNDEEDLLRSCFKCILFAAKPLSPKELHGALYFGVEEAHEPPPWEGLGKEESDRKMALYVGRASKGLAEVVRVRNRLEVQFIHESVRDFLLGRHGSQWSEASDNLPGNGHEVLRNSCLAQINEAYAELRGQNQSDRNDRGGWHAQVPFRPSLSPEHNNSQDSDEDIWGASPKKRDPKRKTSHTKLLAPPPSRPSEDDYRVTNYRVEEDGYREALSTQYGSHGHPYGHRYGGTRENPILVDRNDSLQSYSADRRSRCQKYLPPPNSEYHTKTKDGWDSLSQSSGTEDGEYNSRPGSSRRHRNAQQDTRSSRGPPRPEPKIPRAPPFLAYAIQNVLHHANMAAQHGIQQTNFLAKFPLKNWITLVNNISDAEKYDKATGLLYILAEKNYGHLIKDLQEENSSIFWVGPGRFGPPIFAALSNASHDAAKALLVRQIARPLSESAISRVHKRYDTSRDRHPPEGEGPYKSPFSRTFSFNRDRKLLPYIVEDGNRMVLDVLLRTSQVDINELDKHGDLATYPLSIAAMRGYTDIVDMLLDNGAKLELKGDRGMTALSHAADAGQLETATLLLDRGADINTTCNWQRTPLSYAVSKPSPRDSMIRLLLARNANLEARDIDGRSPLSYACVKKSQECVPIIRLLLEKYASTESRDREGRTPLSHAAREGCLDALRVLCSRGAQVNSQDDHLRTPVWHASEAGHREVVRVLLEKGAQMDSMDRSNRTPLSVAAEGGHKGVVELLVRRGAMARSRDVDGRTPAWYAGRGGYDEIVRLLEGGVGGKR